jgi:hypothetical protein
MLSTHNLHAPPLGTGKTRILEKALISQQGYSAVYYFTGQGGYQLASSAFMHPEDGSIAVDVPLGDTAFLDGLRDSDEW